MVQGEVIRDGVQLVFGHMVGCLQLCVLLLLSQHRLVDTTCAALMQHDLSSRLCDMHKGINATEQACKHAISPALHCRGYKKKAKCRVLPS